jgi:hypothetical protein
VLELGSADAFLRPFWKKKPPRNMQIKWNMRGPIKPTRVLYPSARERTSPII